MAFRGINFKTEEEYDAFMKAVDSGVYTFEQISSWSLNYSYAKRFACCTQKGTRRDDNSRKQELRNMMKEKANITGYKGIVIGIDLEKKMVLCDISQEHIGSMNENEVVLLPGTYPVHILKVIKKEVGQIEWEEDVIRKAEQL